MIISLPIDFEFRAAKVTWSQSFARFIGWWQRPDGGPDGASLKAAVDSSRLLRYAGSRLGREELDILRQLAFGNDDQVKDLLHGEEPLLFIPVSEKQGSRDEIWAASQPVDPWQLRNSFLRLEPDAKNLISFLNEWGNWDSEEFIELGQCTQLQRAIREALAGSTESWFSGPYSLLTDLQRSQEFPFLRMKTSKIETALRMTVTADLLNRAEFKTCARTDCRLPFKVESKRDKRFCSRACAHLESVRKGRRAMREERAVEAM